MSVTDVIEHLMAEFEGQFTLPGIVDVVRGCQQDLRGAPRAPCPSCWSGWPVSACTP